MKTFTAEEIAEHKRLLEMVDEPFDIEAHKRSVEAEYDRRARQEAGFTGKIRRKPTNITPKKKKRKK